MTYITVPIKVESIEKLEIQAQNAKEMGADAIELRLDYWESKVSLLDEVEKVILSAKEYGMKIIATCRASWEGGNFEGSEKSRLAILKKASANADYVDIELKAVEGYLPDFAPATTIISHHNFEEKPIDLVDIVNSIRDISTEAVPKIAFKANRISDSFAAIDLMRDNPGMIAIAMGYEGIITRLLAKKLNALLTFASLGKEESTADGQVNLCDIINTFRFHSSNEDTRLFGIIGSPVCHSRGPIIHNRAFEESNFNGMYMPLLIQADEFEEFMDECLARPWLMFSGFSVTLPHKQNALNYLAGHDGFIDPPAEKIGAINTIIITDDQEMRGYNTDYHGALKAIVDTLNKHDKQLEGMATAVIGAGGVSRAIVSALVDNKADVTIYNRTIEKAESLANVFGCKYASSEEIDSTDAELIINCTSLGMEPNIDTCPVKKETVKAGMAIFDTVYAPLETKLLKYAIEAKALPISGLDMFVNQAVKQFELFTGKSAPVLTMSKSVQG